jgi:hypothetical protein
MEEDKRRFGVMTSKVQGRETIKEKCEKFNNKYSNEYNEIKLNYAVFNQNFVCVRVHKSVTLMELLTYVTWSGFRGAVDQILQKIDYALKSDKDTIYNICLARDFNLNILILKSEKLPTAVGQ